MNPTDNLAIIDPIPPLKALDAALKERFTAYLGLYLFGSHAKGCATDESDIDVLIHFSSIENMQTYAVAGIVGEIEYRFDCFIDYKIFDSREKETINPFVLEQAVQKGIYIGR